MLKRILLLLVLAALAVGGYIKGKEYLEHRAAQQQKRSEIAEVVSDFEWDDYSYRSVSYLTSYGSFAITNAPSMSGLPADQFVLIPGKIPVNRDNVLDVVTQAELMPVVIPGGAEFPAQDAR
ncbi:hypothetical protein SAMN02745181_0348 [Rubritalea squalenifaciens DSM 18772]|uniref:Uncharacterized protein n=1 Tax=Rubritalea squalenifaciens DSM 18772 TaxID=1123071 RepID=A0A1M6BZR4_9BACT|nr:hypothetical protein [Rubritalea squalenifaciens]SHI54101.1 hypothetical protein SAMN02745181_0348 [Rubritalea squalenifaciens DSM 18772]